MIRASSSRRFHMQLPKMVSLALLPALVGCATVGMMKELPPDAGRLALYAAPPDTLVAVAEEAIRRQHLLVADTSRDAPARVVIGSRSPGLFSNGEYVRVRIAPDRDGLMAVRVVSQSGYLLDWAHRDLAPRVFAAMDTQLSATALGPWPGMRVRATPHGGSAIVGRVARVTADTLVLEGDPGSAPPILRTPALDDLAVSRGSYRHTREGGVIGALVGGLLGGLLAHSDEVGFYRGVDIIAQVLVGGAAGALVGGAAGASVRTEVWSPVPIR